jgi:FKBP-type peptidyl-prolyl cis-trans isomerase SlyD
MADRSPHPRITDAPAASASAAGPAGVSGSPGNATGNRQVGPEMVVRLEYQLFDAEGGLVEAPGAEEFIEFIYGVGQAPPAIEKAVDGLRVGESRRVQLKPNEAFGSRDDEAMVVVERSELPEGAALGDEFEAEKEDGEAVFLRVVEIDDEVVRLDANHPLAGQTVTLELRVLALRIATSAELAAAEAALERRGGGEEPDVLASSLLRRDRFTPPKSG